MLCVCTCVYMCVQGRANTRITLNVFLKIDSKEKFTLEPPAGASLDEDGCFSAGTSESDRNDIGGTEREPGDIGGTGFQPRSHLLGFHVNLQTPATGHFSQGFHHWFVSYSHQFIT